MHTTGCWLSALPVAHRGLHDAALPENSLGAFEAAAAAGYAIELDVHLSADDRLVVCHDANTLAHTGVDLAITDTGHQVLTGLRLGDSDYTIPLLDEVLAAVAGRVPILVEVKPSSPAARVGPAVVAALAGYRGEVAVQSFDPRLVLWLRRHAPQVRRGQLAGSGTGLGLSAVRRLAHRAMLANVLTRPAFLAFDADHMPSGFVFFWRTLLRVPLLVWTVRSEQGLRRAGWYGANIIFERVRPGRRPEPDPPR